MDTNEVSIIIISPQANEYLNRYIKIDVYATIECPEDARWSLRASQSNGITRTYGSGVGPVVAGSLGAITAGVLTVGNCEIEIEVVNNDGTVTIEKRVIYAVSNAPRVTIDSIPLDPNEYALTRYVRFPKNITGSIIAGDCPIEMVHWVVTATSREGFTTTLGSGMGQPSDGIFCVLDPHVIPSSYNYVITLMATDPAGLTAQGSAVAPVDGHPPVIENVECRVEGATFQYRVTGYDDLTETPLVVIRQLPLPSTGGGNCPMNSWGGLIINHPEDVSLWYRVEAGDYAGNILYLGSYHVKKVNGVVSASYHQGVLEIPGQ